MPRKRTCCAYFISVLRRLDEQQKERCRVAEGAALILFLFCAGGMSSNQRDAA
jgi:hypothetical protein